MSEFEKNNDIVFIEKWPIDSDTDNVTNLNKTIRVKKWKDFTNFMKLMKVSKEAAKGMEILTISTMFDSMHTKPRSSSTFTHIFESNEVTKEQIKAHCDLVWGATGFGNAVN